MLKAVILFVLLYVIYKIASTFLYNSNGAFDKYFDVKVQKKLQGLPPFDQDQRRSELNKERPSIQKIVFNVFRQVGE